MIAEFVTRAAKPHSLNYNCSLISGRRTTHNPFTSRNKPWDPYGIAKFDLSGLLLGHKYLYLRSPIHCCPLPDTRSGLEKPEGPILGQPGNVDAPGMVLELIYDDSVRALHSGSRDLGSNPGFCGCFHGIEVHSDNAFIYPGV